MVTMGEAAEKASASNVSGIERDTLASEQLGLRPLRSRISHEKSFVCSSRVLGMQ